MKRIRGFTIPDGMTFREFKERLRQRRKIRVQPNHRTIKAILKTVRQWRQHSSARREALGEIWARAMTDEMAGWNVEGLDGFAITKK